MGMMDTMRTMDTYCVQLAAALDGAASRVLRYGDEDEEATDGGTAGGTAGGMNMAQQGREGGGVTGDRSSTSGDRSSTSGDRSSTSALPTLRFDALLGELVHPS